MTAVPALAQEPRPAAAAAPRRPVVAVVGNPNTGKSALFNALTGLRQKVGNYPGVTVEKHLGFLDLGGLEVELVDLPGMYSLAAHSPDELLSLDVLLGRIDEIGPPDAILVVADASNLRRNLFLVSQALELDLPVVVAFNMMDVAEKQGVELDVVELERRLEARIVPVVATRRQGLAELRGALSVAIAGDDIAGDGIQRRPLLPEIRGAAHQLVAELGSNGFRAMPFEVERALIDAGGAEERRLAERLGDEALAQLVAKRDELGGVATVMKLEAKTRYGWIDEILDGSLTQGEIRTSWSDRFDRAAEHPLVGSLIFLTLMATVFQAVFAWATPVMDLIDGAAGRLGGFIAGSLPEGALSSLASDGVIAGVGSVVVFLPQILILFAFILFLEDSGYMARAAFLMDRLMRSVGLSGHSFIPMLSSFACAVPGILATRVIPSRRDRLATILAAPFMTCAARLPVYALLIGAFVPDQRWAWGLINLRGLVLLGLYLLGIAGGVVTALLLKRTLLRGPTPTFLMELPPYRWPSPRSIALRLLDRGKIFLVRAGTVIFTVAVAVWGLAYFPHPAEIGAGFDAERRQAEESLSGPALDERLAEIGRLEASVYLEQSALGRLGKTIEPLFAPLGWDWKVSAAVIAAFPAREVVVAVIGTIYAVGDEVEADDEGLVERIRSARRPDGSRVFSLPMALGVMVFFAFCLQCGATVATIRRETNSWGWPTFAWFYMTFLAWTGAFVTFKLSGMILGV